MKQTTPTDDGQARVHCWIIQRKSRSWKTRQTGESLRSSEIHRCGQTNERNVVDIIRWFNIFRMNDDSIDGTYLRRRSSFIVNTDMNGESIITWHTVCSSDDPLIVDKSSPAEVNVERAQGNSPWPTVGFGILPTHNTALSNTGRKRRFIAKDHRRR